MNAPGPDGVVCEKGCDAWSIDPTCPQHGKHGNTVGPILACESAIAHYDKRLQQLVEDERKILDRLLSNRSEQGALRNSKSQWQGALDILKREQK